MMPTVAILGRPNVGKSSLFNRLVGRRVAIVDPTPGVTRDRIEGVVTWKDREFRLIDTGGMDFDTGPKLKIQIHKQVDTAIGQADVLLFLVDVLDGPLPLDLEIMKRLRCVSKPLLLIANKADHQDAAMSAHGFFQFGVDRVYPVSALHGRGIGELLDTLVAHLPQTAQQALQTPPSTGLKISVLGKPNVGKSSFINALLREPRMIVDDKPGTTRDAVDVTFMLGDKRVVLTDTAGIRRSKKWESAPEFYSISRAKASIRRADVVILIVDAMEGLSQQDRALISMVQEEGKGMVLCLNKWDLAGPVDTHKFAEAFFEQIPFARHLPLVYVSALQNKNVQRCIREAQAVFEEAGKMITTKKINKVLEAAQKRQAHPSTKGRVNKIFFAAQTGSHPPRFRVFVSNRDRFSESYLRYMEGELRAHFGFHGIPIRFELKNRRDS